jgi:hypothetical protein
MNLSFLTLAPMVVAEAVCTGAHQTASAVTLMSHTTLAVKSSREGGPKHVLMVAEHNSRPFQCSFYTLAP